MSQERVTIRQIVQRVTVTQRGTAVTVQPPAKFSVTVRAPGPQGPAGGISLTPGPGLNISGDTISISIGALPPAP